jgi:hypothetical protein
VPDLRECIDEIVDRAARADADDHVVLHERQRGLCGHLLLLFGRHLQ